MRSLFSRVGLRARRSPMPPATANLPAWRPVFYKTLSVHLLATTMSSRRRRF